MISDEKFFEELLKEKTAAKSEFEVGLAKASSAPSETVVSRPNMASKPVSAPKAPTKKYENEPEGQLALDVYQTPTEIIVESAIAGINPEDIDITATNDSIAIRGERRREREIKDDNYLYQECYWGRFSRSVILPQEVDPEGAVVNFKNGILTVTLPKLNKAKQKKLKIKSE